MKKILGAISFLSRIPVRTNLKPSEICGDFPAVGYLSGGLYVILIWSWGRSIPAIIVTVFIIYLFFNAFHFDGLLDSADAFMSQKIRERKLEIMKMGNIGPMALIVGTLYMILKVHVIGDISFMGILASTVSSRYAMVFTAYFSRPAKVNGLGNAIFPVKSRHVLHASIYLIPFLFFPKYLFVIFFALISAFLVKFISDRMIGGITGDVLGAIEEISEITGMVLAFYLGLR